jgi:antitoxin component HigA of HigAB toxin-antitoxin module
MVLEQQSPSRNRHNVAALFRGRAFAPATRCRLEARNLTQRHPRKLFATKGITSEVFHAKRATSKTQAKKRAAFFHVTADLFI